jgi:hypothetical protein
VQLSSSGERPQSQAACPAALRPPRRPAALAAASELLKGDNPAWAAKALEHARQLYAFATEFPKSYMEVNDNGALEIHRYFYTRWGAARAGCAAAGPRTLACVCAQEF